jgi:hypothetical protein
LSIYLTATTVTVGVFVGAVRNGKAFRATMSNGEARTFDGFECAVHVLVPTCEYCGVRVIGHGVCCSSGMSPIYCIASNRSFSARSSFTLPLSSKRSI